MHAPWRHHQPSDFAVMAKRGNPPPPRSGGAMGALRPPLRGKEPAGKVVHPNKVSNNFGVSLW